MTKEPDQPAEQTGSRWAKTLHDDLGPELVRRWNDHESMRVEIERLRGMYGKSDEENDELRAEIERLRAAREMMQMDAEKYRDEAKKLHAEVERLHQAWSADHDAWVNDNDRLRALLRRHHLRGAFWDSDLAEETRAALEPKP